MTHKDDVGPPCKRGDYTHHNASPSHAEGAWCNDCGDFVQLAQFDGSEFTGSERPYLTDMRGVKEMTEAYAGMRIHMTRIARLAGPGNGAIRFLAVNALAPQADPRIRLVWIDGADDGAQTGSCEDPENESGVHSWRDMGNGWRMCRWGDCSKRERTQSGSYGDPS